MEESKDPLEASKNELEKQKAEYELASEKEKEVHHETILNVEARHSREIKELTEAFKKELLYLQGKLDGQKELAGKVLNLDKAQKRISELEKKYLRKQPREKYPDRNVVYILTNEDLKARRTYILGKATNLTARLSSYNKTAEHEVVFYQPCENKECMSMVESVALSKLDCYRELKNRDRFVVPPEKELDVFERVIKETFRFLSVS